MPTDPKDPPKTHASKLPCGAHDTTESDLSQPVANLLDSVQLLTLPTTPEGNTAAGLIESTALQLTNQVKKLIAALGGGAAVLGGASSVWAGLEGKPVLAAVVAAGVAIIVSTSVIGLAMVMNGDVRGRAAVTAQHIEARGVVTARFIDALCCCPKTPVADAANKAKTETSELDSDLRTALAAFGRTVVIRTDGGEATVDGCTWDSKRGLRLRLSSGDIVDMSEISGFYADPPATPSS